MSATPSPDTGNFPVPKPLLALAASFLLGGGVGGGAVLARPQQPTSVPSEITAALNDINVHLTKIDDGINAQHQDHEGVTKRLDDFETRLRALEQKVRP